MRFKPAKQINTILNQQYFEPTITWSLRIVLALNVPLLAIPLYKGFSFEVIWAAFGAYMLSLIDYRGLHYKKVLMQIITAALVFLASLVGMYATRSVLMAVIAMFIVGMCLAIIRNWHDYGANIAVAAGFFFLFGLATPVSFNGSLVYCTYLMVGCAWAILISIISFPFRPSNPLRRSVAKIWKANTDLLDVMIVKITSDKTISLSQISEKEMAVRNLINQSRNYFKNRENKKTRLKTRHYDQMVELRKTASLFSATLSALQEELEIINTQSLQTEHDISFYKTLSALAQASARVSIVIFTQRPNDLSLAKIRITRCEAAITIFSDLVKELKANEKEKQALRHFTEALFQALYYLQLGITQIEAKQKIQKSDYLENYKLSFNEFISGLKPVALTDFISEIITVNRQQINYALRVASGLALGVFIFKYFNINHGYWIPLTMMIVIQPYYGATLKKGIERMVGTVAGIILGGLIILLHLPKEAYVVILIIDSFCVAYFLRNNYKVGVFFVTIMMVLLMQISQQGTWQLIAWRILSTLIGALLALLAGFAFWPSWEKERFPGLLANALAGNKNYLLQVIASIQNKLPVGQSWYHLRGSAEAANNNAFFSAQRMLEEPEHAQLQADKNFALVGNCVRMSREITSVGLSGEKNKATEILNLDDFSKNISLLFDEIILNISKSNNIKDNLDFSAAKQSLAQLTFEQTDTSQFVRLEFEKIVFELEAVVVLLTK